MDDRSIVAADEATLARDMASTDAFDWETGALENASKRQVWRRGEKQGDRTHRNLGGARQAGYRDQASCRLGEVLKKIRVCPGGLLTRTVLTKSYAKPLWSWCAPVFSLPPKSVVQEAFKTLIKSNSKWWCQGRFWCQNVELHPRFSSILVAVQRITEWDIQWSSFLWNNFKRFFEELDLTLEKYDAEKGVLFSRKVTECNKNVIKAFGRRRRVWSDAPDALHLIRTVCRSRTLETIKKTRWDADGADDVDIEASSRIPGKFSGRS